MQINVNIYSYLRYYLPGQDKLFQEQEWHMPEGATVSHVLEKLNLPKEVRIMVLLNNNSVDQKAVLKEGDIVHILPMMMGG